VFIVACCSVCADDNIDETYGINVQFEESEEEASFSRSAFCFRCECRNYGAPSELLLWMQISHTELPLKSISWGDSSLNSGVLH